MNRRQRLIQVADRALLGAIMFSLTFVFEKALDRLVGPRAERPQSHRGGVRQTLFRRLVPGLSAQLRHTHNQAASADSGGQVRTWTESAGTAVQLNTDD